MSKGCEITLTRLAAPVNFSKNSVNRHLPYNRHTVLVTAFPSNKARLLSEFGDRPRNRVFPEIRPAADLSDMIRESETRRAKAT